MINPPKSFRPPAALIIPFCGPLLITHIPETLLSLLHSFEMVSSFTVLGATGNVGKQVVSVLLAAGHHVNVLLRKTDSDAAIALKNQGATLIASGYVEGDEKLGTLSIDESILTKAFTNVDGVFALIPPNLSSARPDEHADAYVQVLKRAVLASKVPKVVFLSSIGAHQTQRLGSTAKLHRLETVFTPLAGPHLRIVFVRAGSFFTNLLQGIGASVNGVFPSICPKDLPVPFLSTDDIGDEAAKHLLDASQKEGFLVVELAGPRDVSYGEAADLVSKALGKELQFIYLPSESIVETLKSFGFSQLGAESMKEMIDGINGGLINYENKETLVRGKRTIEEYIAAVVKK